LDGLREQGANPPLPAGFSRGQGNFIRRRRRLDGLREQGVNPPPCPQVSHEGRVILSVYPPEAQIGWA
jgi:hypothetical protein